MPDNLTLIKRTEKSSEKPNRYTNYMEETKRKKGKKKKRRHGGYFGQKGKYKDMLDEAGS